ncbi:glycosyl transferase family protein [Paraburkholderia caballeronis]|uniref:glycosyl transferase family protein n=1 Tax=Paraburkholderia caballeronis TaxID=416943 RepID=UPI001066B765|nr:glycosyl transferase family protein [Paraburkholderia caballeronis]TDV09526.1 adsorption protein B [Paraburkholderia caballeronis]TDV13797.1 adsorption protein B [Paraburkholderia caballeronis]TDV22979.1 adsorption protein B [Paraburkholderia caballeronis]
MTFDTLKWWSGYLLGHYYHGMEYVAMGVAVLILLSSADDLFIDAWYWVRTTYRYFTVARRYRPLRPEELYAREQQPLAIMVPAWKEDDVIASMVTDLVRVLDYTNYVVFVGTYQNDAPTIAEVERMRRRYKQLHRVEVPHDGPTCKADCLNWIIQAIFRLEQETGVEFAGVILHDSEDVLHPLELRFFNYLLPRKDMIQLPVASLERDWYELVAGTYMDEFAEWHAKDLVVRESIAGAVPSAGVGTCFSRRALIGLAEQTNNQPFNTETLTEDYDVGERLGRMGMNSIFARFPVQFSTRRKSWFGFGRERDVTLTMPLCVREFFPDTFRTAYRQRARWTLGIGLQGWQQTGWRGSLANRYLLARDRKGIVTSFVGIVAYVVLVQFILFAFADTLGLMPQLIASPFIDSRFLYFVLWANGIALSLRVLQRVYFVTRLYGWEHGVLAVPRMVIGNFVNFMAVARAWRMFLVHLATGKRLAWDKTMHDFPSSDGFTDRRQRLGELLVSWQAIDEEKLARALGDEHAGQAPLGRVLLAHGWLDEETLAEAIAFQSDLPRDHLDEARLRANASQLPPELVVRNRVLPYGDDRNGHAVLLTASPLPDDAFATLQAALKRPAVQRIVREGEIAAGLRILRGVPVAGTPDDETAASRAVPLLGDLLIERGAVSRKDFEDALLRYRPADHGRIGDYMVALGVITADALKDAIDEQKRRMGEPVMSR